MTRSAMNFFFPGQYVDLTAENVLMSFVKRGSAKFGGNDAELHLLVLKDGTAIAPNRDQPESRVNLNREELDHVITRIFDECDAVGLAQRCNPS